MRGIFGKPQGTCSRVSIVQALLLVRCKDNNNENLAQESLRGRTLSRHSNTALHYPLLLRKDYSIKWNESSFIGNSCGLTCTCDSAHPLHMLLLFDCQQ
ncbi:uncharacterized protein [Typha latifolia]|uniref:uncharacterized protein isoform X6 n=1 Tax=Typha latifolia TaxID=4733 RepID=UPI003C309B77